MESETDLPITGVCIVSDPGRCPPNYTVIEKTHDRTEDADLWKGGLFGRHVMRYLCVERQIPMQGKDVLVDVALITERDSGPAGFTVVENTHDSREKATQKKFLCVRWMVPSMTNDSITELILLTRNQRRAPAGYSLVGELNNLSLCYKMGKLPQVTSSDHDKPSHEIAGYSTAPQAFTMPQNDPGLPYSLSSSCGQGPGGNMASSSLACTGPPENSTNNLSTVHVNPLSGVEWKINPKYRALMMLQNMTIPEIRGKTLMEIENQYAYDYSVERGVSKTASALT